MVEQPVPCFGTVAFKEPAIAPGPCAHSDCRNRSCTPYTRRTRRTIEKLRTDNYKLKDELFLETKHSSLPSNSAVTTQISKLQDQADVFTRKIEIEKRRATLGAQG